MIFGNQGMVLTPTFLEHRLLEEDLDLQLHLLQEHETNLFPEVEAPMLELPHHKDHTLQKNAGHVAHKANIDLALVETIFEVSVDTQALNSEWTEAVYCTPFISFISPLTYCHRRVSWKQLLCVRSWSLSSLHRKSCNSLKHVLPMEPLLHHGLLQQRPEGFASARACLLHIKY